MRTVGAVQFIVTSGNPVSEGAFVSVRRSLRQLIAEALPAGTTSPDLPTSGDLKVSGGHELDISAAGEDGGPALWTCTWSHPDEANEGVIRKERLQLAQLSPGSAQFETLELASAPDSMEERLSVPHNGMPFVAAIIQSFQCSIEERPISSVPRLVADETVVNFVKDTLSSPRRRLPLILISKDQLEGTPLVDPTQLARSVAGLAEVSLLQDHSVALGLSDLLPRRLACVNGSVRIFNPGFSAKDDPLRHPLILGDTIKSWRKTTFDPEVYFLERVAKHSVISHSEGVTIRESRSLLRDQLGRQLAQHRSTRASLEEQVSSLKLELEERTRYAQELEDELERQRRLWFEYRPRGIESEIEAVPPSEVALPDFSSVHAALQYAASQWPEDVTVLQTAWDSAHVTDSRRRTEVFTAIAALREVARQSFAGASFGVNLETLFRQRYNLRYRSQDHQATVDEYGDYRRFLYNGQRVLFESHITIGPNSDSCLQIYFLLDATARKVVIGYCGKHLPTKGWQS